MNRKIILFIVQVFLGLTGCNTTEPPPPDGEKPTLALKLEDVSCTEAWIELNTTNLQLPAEINLIKNDNVAQTISLSKADTLLYIDSLLPNQSYKYQVSSIQHQVSSNELSVTTMDTTSHDFTFETFTFGGTAGSSVLYDVAIISPDNIWCVGEILVADTSINGYTTYNAVHWDGVEWELKRIPFLFQGDSFYNPIYAIFAFNADDIWFGIGNLIHWDGVKYWSIGISTVFPSLVNKIWGSSSSNLYVVGNNGNIVHYNGTLWRRIESGTEQIIRDIWGVNERGTNQRKVFCTVLSSVQLGEHKILTIDENNKIDSLHWATGRILTSSWTKEGRFVYTSGWGVFNNKAGYWLEETTIPLFYTSRIRGNALNDIVAVGYYGFLVHYNGRGWKLYDEFLQMINADFYSVAIEEEKIVAVGYDGEKALIVIGRRN